MSYDERSEFCSFFKRVNKSFAPRERGKFFDGRITDCVPSIFFSLGVGGTNTPRRKLRLR